MSSQLVQQAKENNSKLNIAIENLNKVIYEIEETGIEVSISIRKIDSKDRLSMNTIIKSHGLNIRVY